MNQNYIISLFTLFFVSCSSSKNIETLKKRDYKEIINKQINFLVKGNFKKVNIEVNLSEHFWEFMDDLKYDEKNYRYSFLHNTYSLSKEELKTLFNEEQINYYKKQSTLKESISKEILDNKRINIIEIDKVSVSALNYNESLLILSKPFFSINKEYCLIGYYNGNLGRDMGESGFTIYKKENEKWILYKNIPMGIS
jgi:hypothetical protein